MKGVSRRSPSSGAVEGFRISHRYRIADSMDGKAQNQLGRHQRDIGNSQVSSSQRETKEFGSKVIIARQEFH
jgi:hypothetical protein